MTLPQGTESDAVGRAFRELYVRATAVTAEPTADTIMARARRRRITQVAVAGGAALVSVAVAFALLGPARVAPRAVDPAATVSASSSPVPSGTRTDAAASIPVGFFLNETGAADERVDNEQVLESCFGRPRLASSVARSVGEAASLTTVHHQLLVYPDESTARQVFATMRPALQACVGRGGSTQLATGTPSLGDEAASVTIAIPGRRSRRAHRRTADIIGVPGRLGHRSVHKLPRLSGHSERGRGVRLTTLFVRP